MVPATRQILDAQTEPVILVGHSYGGAVVTQAGTHEKVAALAYITAFVPDGGESVNTLTRAGLRDALTRTAEAGRDENPG